MGIPGFSNFFVRFSFSNLRPELLTPSLVYPPPPLPPPDPPASLSLPPPLLLPRESRGVRFTLLMALLFIPSKLDRPRFLEDHLDGVMEETSRPNIPC